MLRYLFPLLICLSVVPAHAQRPSDEGLFPTLIYRENGKVFATLLETLDVDVTVRGLLAETTMTMTFRNPHARVLEGEILFPLPEGATVSGYALDIEGQLVEGVVVEKHAARIAYEMEVRAGVDPGLVEWTRGNNFRSRVYPIPAGGTRTVRVRYVSEIGGTPRSATFVLPLAFETPVARFDLKVEIVRGTTRPTVVRGLVDLTFDRWEDRWVAERVFQDVVLDEDLRIALPDLPEYLVSVERDGDDVVFVIHDSPVAPEPPPRQDSVRRVGLYWDASLSEEGDRARELDFLETLVSSWDDVWVDVQIIREDTERLGSWSVGPNGAAALREALEAVSYDGGTALGAVTFPAEPTAADAGPDRYDFHLLFSDGLSNIGSRLPTTSSAPVHTITQSSGADHLLLRHLASSTGGEHINLTRRTPTEAAAGLRGTRYMLLGVDYDPREVEEIYPRRSQPVQGRVDVTGRLLVEEATVVLRYGYGPVVTRRVPITLRRADSTGTGLVARFWAQQKVTELAVFSERHGERLLGLGRRYGLVTPGTSLLVLETLEQHLEHDVRPSDSRPALRDAWTAQRAIKRTEETDGLTAHLENLVALWTERVAWWSRDYTYDPTDEPRAADRPAPADPDLQPPGTGDVPPPPAPAPPPSPPSAALSPTPAPAPPPSPRSGTRTDDVAATIEVTGWDPQTPYMAVLKAQANRDQAYAMYLAQRVGYQQSPGYYLDVASWFYSAGDALRGRRVLTCLLDLGLDDPALVRIVAYRLLEAEEVDLAIELLEDVLPLRPEEPQSHRDLALALARRGESESRWSDPESATADLERAMSLLHYVVMTPWPRFAEIEVVALEELNRLITTSERLAARHGVEIRVIDLDARLRTLLDVDLRIALTWDADLTDIDLWITEPGLEKAYFSNPRTAIGGLVSRDFTAGYGPEVYMLRRLVPGSYAIQVDYYGSSQQSLVGPATVKATIFTNYGRSTETRRDITLRLEEVKDVVDVGQVDLDLSTVGR